MLQLFSLSVSWCHPGGDKWPAAAGRDTGAASRLSAATACAHSFGVDCYNSVLFLGGFRTPNFIGNETEPHLLRY
ncbi:MAG: hypothetical protein JRE28_07880 [Deltaproteobacteria bacterium]|nr:hypothetical protein [Deltaproteobacteria bacterium]